LPQRLALRRLPLSLGQTFVLDRGLGALPFGFDLRRVCSAALAAEAGAPARRFITLLTGPASLVMRRVACFQA
jgi:hypothetical protein